MTADERQELCALYVLGALEPPEVALVEARIEDGDEAFIRDISTFRETVSMIPRTLAPIPPSPSVREGLMARIQATPEAAEPALVVSQTDRSASGLSRLWGWVPAAAAAVVALSLGWLASDFRSRIGTLEHEVHHWRGVAQKQEQLLELMTSADVKVMTLTGSEEAPQAGARILWDTERHQWTVLIYDLPPLPSEKTYQLWFLTGKSPIPSETFQSDAEGNGVVQIRFPNLQSAIAGAAVSIEPKGGVPQPTGPIYLSGQF